MGKKHLKFVYLILTICIVGNPISSLGQDVDGLLSLIQKGEQDSATVILTDLSYEYPGHPGLRYARALMQDDALVAAGLYKDIVRNHRDSQFAGGALMHLGEYYYAQGLYVQSRQHLSRVIRFHPNHPDLVNAVNLSLRAGIAARLMDSVYIDLADIVDRYPDMAFDLPEELDITRIPGRKARATESFDADPIPSAPIRTLGQDIGEPATTPRGQYVLQAGAFGNYDNARRLADQIESIGYSTVIKERRSNGKTLYLIRVGDYPSKTAALSVADMLDAALGIESFPALAD